MRYVGSSVRVCWLKWVMWWLFGFFLSVVLMKFIEGDLMNLVMNRLVGCS